MLGQLTARHSEVIKTDFNALISYLKQCGKSVFISGPIPTIGRGWERFSRLLSLNTWLRATCGKNNVGFIDNFALAIPGLPW